MFFFSFYLEFMQQRQFVVKAYVMQTKEKYINLEYLSLDILSGYRWTYQKVAYHKLELFQCSSTRPWRRGQQQGLSDSPRPCNTYYKHYPGTEHLFVQTQQ